MIRSHSMRNVVPAVHAGIVKTFDLRLRPSGAEQFLPPPEKVLGGRIDLRRLIVARGKVLLGNHAIHNPDFMHNTVGWSQIANGIRSSGNLTFRSDGLVAIGKIHLEAPDGTGESYLVFGTQALTQFKTKYSVDGTTWMSGPDLEVGVVFNSRFTTGVGPEIFDVQQIVNVYGCDSGGTYAAVNYVDLALAAFSLSSQGTLQVDFGPSVTFTPPPCANGTFTFPLPSGSFEASGSIVYAEDGASFTGSVYDFTGSTAYQFQGEDPTGSQSAAGVVPADYINLRMRDSAPLSVEDLASQTLPDVQALSSQLLFQCLLYVMPDDLRTALTGYSQPTNLGDGVVSTITQPAPCSFLNDFYAPTYFGYGLSQQQSLAGLFSADQVTQLQYTASAVLSQQSAFTIVNNATFSEAALTASARLADYNDDGAAKWASNLYAYVTAQDQVNQVQTEVFGANNSDTLNRFVSLLTVFDPSGTLAKQYYSAIMGAAMFSHMTFAMDPSNPESADEFDDILPDVLQTIINTWLIVPADPTQGELERQQAAVNLQTAADEAGGIEALAGSLSAAFAGGSQLSMYSRLQAAASNILTNPTAGKALKVVAGGVGVIGFACGCFFALKGITNWSSLTDAQQLSVVGQGVQIAATVIDQIPGFVTAFSGKVADAALSFQEAYMKWTGSALQFGDLEVNLEGLSADDLIFNRSSSVLIKDVAANGFKDGGQFLFKLGSTISQVAKSICIMGQAIVAGITIYGFIEDIANGAPIGQDILDGINVVSSMVIMMCDVTLLVVESAIAATLSMVFGFVGVIAGLIAYFISKSPPPPSPAQQYVTNAVLPFIGEMNVQYPVPSGWTMPSVPSSS